MCTTEQCPLVPPLLSLSLLVQISEAKITGPEGGTTVPLPLHAPCPWLKPCQLSSEPQTSKSPIFLSFPLLSIRSCHLSFWQMTFFCNFHHLCNKQKIWRLTALQNLSFLFSFISPSPRFLHKLARKPVHKLSNLHLTRLPSCTQQLTLSPSVYASLFLSCKTRAFVAVEKGSPSSALMALFMDKKCHFQCNSVNISGILARSKW